MQGQQFPTTCRQHSFSKKFLGRNWLGVRGRLRSRCCQAAHIKCGQYQSHSYAHTTQMKTKGEEEEQLSFSGPLIYNISSWDSNLYKGTIWASPVAQMVKSLSCNTGDLGTIPGLGRSPGEGNGNPLQYSCLENPMDRGAWWAAVHGAAHDWVANTFTFHYMCKQQSHLGGIRGVKMARVQGAWKVMVMVWMLVSLQNAHVEILTPNMIVLACGALGND